MNNLRLIPSAVLVLLVSAGCSDMPKRNLALDQATDAYRVAQSDPQTGQLAPLELKLAGDAVNQATEAWRQDASATNVNHLAYLATQRVAIAHEVALQHGAEAQVAQARGTRNELRLGARTQEAESAQRMASASQAQTEVAKQEAAQSQQLSADAQARSQLLESQLLDLKAQKTARGVVITFQDLLFDTDQARLKEGGLTQVSKLADILQQNQQRTVVIEGHTDSTGSDAHNLQLSTMRADAVKSALVKMGISPTRLQSKGFGEANPISDNSQSAGRQLNRRVEIVLSKDGEPMQ
jgi:outer membrane protein OmpA-like peptidoglycan-associated protein